MRQMHSIRVSSCRRRLALAAGLMMVTAASCGGYPSDQGGYPSDQEPSPDPQEVQPFATGEVGAALSKLRVAANGRFLERSDGGPFFWIGDTMWLWEHLTAAEQDEYLALRQAQGYTVIQTRVGDDEVVDLQNSQARWRGFDAWLQRIKAHDLYAAVGIGWIVNPWDPNPQFTEAQMESFGQWVGNRYRDHHHIIWLAANESTWPGAPMARLEALIRGIRSGDTGRKLLTVHPLAGGASSYFFKNLDFNSWQTARHRAPVAWPDYSASSWSDGTYTVWEAIAHDYNATPARPVIDLEAWYEGGLDDLSGGTIRATAWHVRSRAYFTILAGAFGHTYGTHLYGPGFTSLLQTWRDTLRYPGGRQMGHLRALLESPARPLRQLVPDQSLVTQGQGAANDYDTHKQAARATNGSFAYVYSADGGSFSVNLNALGGAGRPIRAQWFNPRDGSTSSQNLGGSYARVSSQPFDPPGSPGRDNDWVLVLSAESTVSPPPSPATYDVVVDNLSAACTRSSGWTASSAVPGYYSANYHHAPAGSGSRWTRFTFPNVPAGTYDLSARWTSHPNRAKDARYAVRINGTLAGSPQLFDQRSGGGAFNSFASARTVTVDHSTIEVELTDTASGYVIADAVRVARK